MAIIEKRLGTEYKKQWHKDHPKSKKVVLSKQYEFNTGKTMHDIVKWIEDNTDGHSTAELKRVGISDRVTMIWFFEDKNDALKFKMIWG